MLFHKHISRDTNGVQCKWSQACKEANYSGCSKGDIRCYIEHGAALGQRTKRSCDWSWVLLKNTDFEARSTDSNY